jgi:hypothetical protein
MTRRRDGISADLAQAAARFDQWRRSALSTGRIPDSLWNLAAELAHEHGVSRTASTLRLGYYDLKKRVAERAAFAQAGSRGTVADGFVELNPAALAMPCQCTIEFEKPCGSRLRIELQGSVPDLEALGRSFWESR